jgi:hypothetical protein
MDTYYKNNFKFKTDSELFDVVPIYDPLAIKDFSNSRLCGKFIESNHDAHEYNIISIDSQSLSIEHPIGWFIRGFFNNDELITTCDINQCNYLKTAHCDISKIPKEYALKVIQICVYTIFNNEIYIGLIYRDEELPFWNMLVNEINETNNYKSIHNLCLDLLHDTIQFKRKIQINIHYPQINKDGFFCMCYINYRDFFRYFPHKKGILKDKSVKITKDFETNNIQILKDFYKWVIQNKPDPKIILSHVKINPFTTTDLQTITIMTGFFVPLIKHKHKHKQNK